MVVTKTFISSKPMCKTNIPWLHFLVYMYINDLYTPSIWSIYSFTYFSGRHFLLAKTTWYDGCRLYAEGKKLKKSKHVSSVMYIYNIRNWQCCSFAIIYIFFQNTYLALLKSLQTKRTWILKKASYNPLRVFMENKKNLKVPKGIFNGSTCIIYVPIQNKST